MAWGFASTDSDYDVRFIYIRPRDFYLKLESTRDVIEIPIEGAFDINGWDLNKTLRLAYKPILRFLNGLPRRWFTEI